MITLSICWSAVLAVILTILFIIVSAGLVILSIEWFDSEVWWKKTISRIILGIAAIFSICLLYFQFASGLC